MCVGYLRSSDHLLHSSVLHSEGYIVEHSVVKQYRLLIHIPHHSAQIMHTQIAYVMPIHLYRTAIDVIEPRQQVGHSRLSATALTHKGDSLSRLDRKAHTLHHRHLRVISESHILIPYLTLQVLDCLRLLRIRDGIDGIQYGIHALHRRQALLYAVHCLCQILGRIDHRIENDHIVYERGGIHPRGPAEDECSAKHKHYGNGYGAKKLAHRVGKRLPALHIACDAEKLLITAMKTVCNLLFGIESLDDAKPAEGLLYIAHELAPLLLPLERCPLEPLAHTPHYRTRYRQKQKHEHC